MDMTGLSNSLPSNHYAHWIVLLPASVEKEQLNFTDDENNGWEKLCHEWDIHITPTKPQGTSLEEGVERTESEKQRDSMGMLISWYVNIVLLNLQQLWLPA